MMRHVLGLLADSGALHEWLADPRAELRDLVDQRFPRITSALSQPVPASGVDPEAAPTDRPSRTRTR